MLSARAWTLSAAATSLLAVACHPAAPRVPWADIASEPPPEQHAHVRTLSLDYARDRSHVLVRQINLPTRAALDYAAYHANFLFAVETPRELPQPPAAWDTVEPFEGTIERESLTADIAATPLSASERAAPLAYVPLTEFLQAQHVGGATALAALGATVQAEIWGGSGLVEDQPSQRISEVYIHHITPQLSELWLKIEVAPWFRGLGVLPDPDRDGYPEVYGRASTASASYELLDAIEADYSTRVLSSAEVKIWASQLASQWRAAFDAHLVPVGDSWPDAQTEPEITSELAGLSVAAPSVVLRGKLKGRAFYAVFVVKNTAAERTVSLR